jgi:hypothetical protein
MSDRKSRDPYSGTPTGRGPPLTHPQESVDNIIEIPSDQGRKNPAVCRV